MLVADDFQLESAGESYRSALFVFFVGDIVTWVGIELLHRSFQVGISARRAEWFSRWTRDTASADHIHMGKFEEGLGRVMYVVGALEFERPFLGPLYKFMSIHPRNSVRRVPAYVSFILRYLNQQIRESRQYSCATEIHPMASAPRVDAQASLTRTGIGGWLPVLGPDGRADLYVVQRRDPRGGLAMDLQEGRQAFAGHLDLGSSGGLDGAQAFPREPLCPASHSDPTLS